MALFRAPVEQTGEGRVEGEKSAQRASREAIAPAPLCCSMAHFNSAAMSCNKTRLYIGLYVRGGSPKMAGKEDTYHWALLSGPKREPKSGHQHTMYHVKAKLVIEGEPKVARSEWEYSAECDRTSMLLARIVIAKVCNLQRLERILQQVPLRPDKEGWNGVAWVREAIHLASLDADALGSRVADWDVIRDKAMWYVNQKKSSHRFDGLGQFDITKPATWDMLQDKEVAI
ncbi:hypothetical protein E4U41_004109 [Claviceps citrina]|nr:hypothetical protein E4U41_004109 [Claviceps citrina]